MSSSQELYNRLDEKLRESVRVNNRKQVTNWIWIIVGILQSQSSHLSQIANYLPLATKAESRVTLIRRWLKNPQVKVWQFYKQILEHVLSGWSAVDAYIILDGVMVFGARWQIFQVSLRHGCRAIPIAWTIVEGNGLVKVNKLKSMLEKVQRFLKRYVKRVTFLADAGFRDCDWAQLCLDLGWNYAIHIACNTYITLPDGTSDRLDNLVPVNRNRYFQNVLLTRETKLQTNVSVSSHMVPQESLLVILVGLIDLIPMPPEPAQRKRGHPKTYPDGLFLKAWVVMIIQQVHTPSGLLAILAQPTAEMQVLRQELSLADGRFACRRTWERRLAAIPCTLPAR